MAGRLPSSARPAPRRALAALLPTRAAAQRAAPLPPARVRAATSPSPSTWARARSSRVRDGAAVMDVLWCSAVALACQVQGGGGVRARAPAPAPLRLTPAVCVPTCRLGQGREGHVRGREAQARDPSPPRLRRCRRGRPNPWCAHSLLAAAAVAGAVVAGCTACLPACAAALETRLQGCLRARRNPSVPRPSHVSPLRHTHPRVQAAPPSSSRWSS